MQLVLDLLAETTRIGDEEEVEVHQTVVCLLCGDSTERVYMAKEVTEVSKLGEVKHTQLVSENGDKPAFTSFESTTHRQTCPVCPPRLRRLSRGQLVSLVVKLAKQTMYEAKRRGVIDISDTTEIKRR